MTAAARIASAAAAFALAAGAETLETATALFSGETAPEGWTQSGPGYVSPEYEGPVRKIEMSYAPGAAAVFARAAGGADETQVASVSAATDGAALTFPSASAFRSFRIVPADASFALASFAAVWRRASDPAVPCSSILYGDGYCEDFGRFAGLSWSPAERQWDDGVTVPCWQACLTNGTAVSSIKRTSGTGNKSGGLYAYYGTNKTDSSYSLAAVSNSKNALMFGFAVTNDTGETLVSFELSFAARQWSFSKDRKAEQTLTLQYLVTNELVSISAEGQWADLPAATFATTATVFDPADSEADAATGSLRRDVSVKLKSVSLNDGQLLLFRWIPSVVSYSEALGVDDVSLACSRSQRGLVVQLVDAARR